MTVIKKGSTSVSRYIILVDSTAGTPETGYTITDLDLQYTRSGKAPAAKVDATALAATDSAWDDNKAFEVDGTSSPGLYRVDWPDAAFASEAGVDKVILCVSGSGLHPAYEEIQLVDYDPEDGVRLGLTALPDAVAGASTGLLISGSNAGTTTLGALTVTGATTHTGATTYTGAVTASNASNDIVGIDVAKYSGSQTAADNAEIVFDTDFATNYDTATNKWTVEADVLEVLGVAASTDPIDGTEVLLNAEIASFNSQTSFVLATGSDQDDAYVGQTVVVYDDDNSDYPSVRRCTAYTGGTLTLVIDSAPNFTVGNDDSVRIFVADAATSAATTELAAVPAATASMEDKINWLFMLARNKVTQTNTTQTVMADDTSTPVATSAVADDGTTASRAEWT